MRSRLIGLKIRSSQTERKVAINLTLESKKSINTTHNDTMAHILPNEIIFRIIREADGGRYTHQKKMMMKDGVFDMITGLSPIYLYPDAYNNLCLQYVWEDFPMDDSDSEDETSDEED